MKIQLIPPWEKGDEGGFWDTSILNKISLYES